MEFFYLKTNRKMRSRRFHIIIGSVLFATLMWISINLSEEYQVSMEIPLVVANLPERKALSKPVPKSVNVKVKGTGWRLASMLFSGKPSFVLNTSEFGESPTVITKSNLLDNIYLTSGVKPVDINVDTLVLDYAKYSERRVKVIPNISLECAEGYGVVGELQVSPESVTIAGAENVVRSLDTWRTEHHAFANLHESFSSVVNLEGSHSYSVDVLQKNVRISINVQPLAEKTFSGIAVEAVMVPPNKDIIFIPPKIDLIVRGGIDRLAALSENDFHVTVHYESLLADTTAYIQPKVEFPSGVRILIKRPERVQYVIRKRL